MGLKLCSCQQRGQGVSCSPRACQGLVLHTRGCGKGWERWRLLSSGCLKEMVLAEESQKCGGRLLLTAAPHGALGQKCRGQAVAAGAGAAALQDISKRLWLTARVGLAHPYTGNSCRGLSLCLLAGA